MNKTLMKVFPVHFYIITIAILIYFKKTITTNSAVLFF